MWFIENWVVDGPKKKLWKHLITPTIMCHLKETWVRIFLTYIKDIWFFIWFLSRPQKIFYNLWNIVIHAKP
jgi:hypothetical protein